VHQVLLTTLTGNAFLVLGTVIFGLLALPMALLPRGANGVFLIAKLWSWGILGASGVRVTCRREVPLAPGRSYVFLANHQSMFDIPVLIGTSPVQLRFAAKRSLFRIPVFGWAIRAGGFIPVDRGDQTKARATFAAAHERLRGGTSVLLFPEGSRSLDGRIQRFERGGFLLALKTGLPIVPVGVRGTLAAQRRGSFRIAPARVEVRYGAPIDPTPYGIRGRAQLEADVRARLEELAGTESAPSPSRPGAAEPTLSPSPPPAHPGKG
jgi:1-acyl-sn-glycerol-3-phosphate acyltransferase